MPEIHQIDAEFSQLHGVVQFRGDDQKYMVIAANKAASMAKSFREAATMINATDERGKAVAEWLKETAGKFDKCENE